MIEIVPAWSTNIQLYVDISLESAPLMVRFGTSQSDRYGWVIKGAEPLQLKGNTLSLIPDSGH